MRIPAKASGSSIQCCKGLITPPPDKLYCSGPSQVMFSCFECMFMVHLHLLLKYMVLIWYCGSLFLHIFLHFVISFFRKWGSLFHPGSCTLWSVVLIHALLQRSNLKCPDKDGNWPIHISAQEGYGHMTWSQLCILGLPALHVVNKHGCTPYHLANMYDTPPWVL